MLRKSILFFITIFLMEHSFAQAGFRSNYDENGVLILPSEARVFNACADARSSQSKYFYYAGGEIFQKVSCENQQKHGVFQQFYPNGILWIEEDYKEGQLNWISRTFDRNGNLQIDQDQVQADVFNNKEAVSEVSRASARPVSTIAENEFWK